MRRLLSRFLGLDTTPARRVRAKSIPLRIEALEGRLVPATLQLVHGLLNYTATAGVANNVSVSLSGSTYTIKDAAEIITVSGVTGATGSGTKTVTLPASQVSADGMTFNLGDKNDALTIDSTHHAIAVNAGADQDVIDVGRFAGGSVSAIQAAVTVDGEAGTDTVRVNDPAGALSSFVVTATKVTTGALDLSYAGAENLTLTAGVGNALFSVRGTAANTRTTLNGGTGSDYFQVGNEALTLDDIKGSLVLNGGAQGALGVGDAVTFLDQGSTAANSYTLKANSLSRSGDAVVVFSEMEQLTLNAGSAADSATVTSTAPGTPVILNMGAGNDVVNLGTRTGTSLDAILTTVTVNGDAGTDSVVVNDQVDDGANAYVVTSTDVSRNALTVLSYTITTESLTINAGNFNDTVSVLSTSAATPVSLKMGGGDDTVEVGFDDFGAGKRLNLIQGALSVDGQAGFDRLTLDDRGNVVGIDYTVTAAAVSRSGAATTAYAGTDYLTLRAASQQIIFLGGGANGIDVKSTSTYTNVYGAEFSKDVITVGSDARSLDTIQGQLSIYGGSGSDSLTLNDQGDANANSYRLGAATVARAGTAPIYFFLDPSFDVPSTVTLNAGAFNDTVLVETSRADTLMTLNLGAGDDAVTLGKSGNSLPAYYYFNSTVTVNGQAGADAVVVDNSDVGVLPNLGKDYVITSTDVTIGALKILAYDTAESLAVFADSGDDHILVASSLATTPIAVQAGAGNDVITVGAFHPYALAGAVSVDGYADVDTIDYSSYWVAVRVNLELGTATGAAGGILNVENVTGGAGDDVIVGNNRDNVLRGGLGRDVLIGRAGSDTIYGGVDSFFGEGGDDLLIAASTAYDLDAARLEDVMREWSRTDLFGTAQQQYDMRVNHLLGVTPGGLNGAATLSLAQMIDDGDADYLDGGDNPAVTERDWFFTFAGDVALLQAGERVN